MPIIPQTPGLHYIGLRAKDMSVPKNFYHNIIGLPLVPDTPELIIFDAGPVFIAFRKADPRDKDQSVFGPFEIGLDHVAMACNTEQGLQRFARGLADAGVENTGVEMDETLQKSYVAFKDPDRIQWGFYMT